MILDAKKAIVVFLAHLVRLIDITVGFPRPWFTLFVPPCTGLPNSSLKNFVIVKEAT